MLTKTVGTIIVTIAALFALVAISGVSFAANDTGAGGSAGAGSNSAGTSSIKDGVNATCPNSKCETKDENGDVITAEKGVKSLVVTIINLLSWLVGVISVIMVIWGGFKYLTSGGEAGKVTSAKNTIIYALVGLVIVALAQVIVLFVLDNVT